MAEKFVYYDYAEWAAISLRFTPGGTADPDLVRQAYIMDCSDRRLHWQERSKQMAAVKSVGGRKTGFATKGTLMYHDVTLVPLAGTQVSDEEVQAVLVSLYAAGVVTDVAQIADAAATLGHIG